MPLKVPSLSEFMKYATSSWIPTEPRYRKCHIANHRSHRTAGDKLTRLKKYSKKLDSYLQLANRYEGDESKIYTICGKVERVVGKINDLHLHGKVKRQAAQKILDVQQSLEDLLDGCDDVDSDSATTTTSSDSSDGLAEDAVKYHIALETVPDIDGL